MSKPHASLSPRTNILLIFLWAGVAAACFLFVQPRLPVVLAVIGGVLGAIGGGMQHLSFVRAAGEFSAASTLLQVRAAFKGTSWGSQYIRFLYLSKILLVVVAFIFVREPSYGVVLGYAGGYFCLMCVRELVTLRDTFALARLFGARPDAA